MPNVTQNYGDDLISKVARKSDAVGIVEVLQANLISIKNVAENSKTDLEERGFLLGALTKEEMENYIADQKNKMVFVLKNGEKVFAYLSACDFAKSDEKMREELSSFPEIKKFQKILYYHQIAKLPEVRNAGKKLLAAMLEEAGDRGYEAVLCRIAHQPIQNKASTAFHEKYGFKLVGMQGKNDVTFGVYLLNL